MIESKYLNQYLTFEILSPGSITWTCSTTNSAAHARSIAYKVLDSSNAVIHDWVNVPSSRLGATLTSGVSQEYNFLTGQKVLIKISDTVNPQAYGSNGSTPFSNYFGGTSQVKVYGNILSLLIGDRVLELTVDNATSTDYNCAFIGLFGGYTNLMDVENLQLGVDTLTPYCYAGMFSGCTNITKSPQLTSVNASAEGCYNEMFSYCSSLSLIKCTATNIGSQNNCINWVENVASNGTFVWANGSFPTTETKSYDNRWAWGINGIPNEWTTMTASQWEDENAVGEEEEESEYWDADELEVINIIVEQYQCNIESLTRETTFASIPNSDENDMTDLINTVENEFEFDIPDSVRSFVTVGEFVDYVMEHAFAHEILPVDGEEEEETNYADEYFTLVIKSIDGSESEGTINIKINHHNGSILSYKINNGIWINILSNVETNIAETLNVHANDKIYFKGNFGRSSQIEFCKFTDNVYDVEGNILSLVYGDNFRNKTSLDAEHSFPQITFPNSGGLKHAHNLILPLLTLTDECYEGMFYGCENMISAPELPATTLTEMCYTGMFQGCSSLEIAPELPATTLADHCYSEMFAGCSSLEIAPELPATTLSTYCYFEMFFECINLTTAPALPATILTQSCYNDMFGYCERLTTAPALPATTLAEACYDGMFNNCTSLINAPKLSAMVLAEACYESMFYGCTALVSAPELPATTLTYGCYRGMFDGCTALVSAPELPAMTLAEACYEGMFRSCEYLTSAPELPSTTLAASCYKEMFQGCINLMRSPILPAITLISRCYEGMFTGCTNLNHISAYHSTYISPNDYTRDWVEGVSETGTYVKNPNTDIYHGPHFVPDDWEVINLTEEMVPKYHLYTDKDSTYEFVEDEMNAGNADTYYDNKRKNIIITDDPNSTDLNKSSYVYISNPNSDYYNSYKKYALSKSIISGVGRQRITDNDSFKNAFDISKIYNFYLDEVEGENSRKKNFYKIFNYNISHHNIGDIVQLFLSNYVNSFYFEDKTEFPKISESPSAWDTNLSDIDIYTNRFYIGSNDLGTFRIYFWATEPSTGDYIISLLYNESDSTITTDLNDGESISLEFTYTTERIKKTINGINYTFKKCLTDPIQLTKTGWYSFNIFTSCGIILIDSKRSLILNKFDSFFTEDSFNNPTVENNVFKFLREKWINKEPYYIDKANDYW